MACCKPRLPFTPPPLQRYLMSHNYSGNEDEKENLRIEKEFDTAAAKGLRPCT